MRASYNVRMNVYLQRRPNLCSCTHACNKHTSFSPKWHNTIVYSAVACEITMTLNYSTTPHCFASDGTATRITVRSLQIIGGMMSTRWPGMALNYQQKISQLLTGAIAVARAPLHEPYVGTTFGPKPLRTYVHAFAPYEPDWANARMSGKTSKHHLQLQGTLIRKDGKLLILAPRCARLLGL